MEAKRLDGEEYPETSDLPKTQEPHGWWKPEIVAGRSGDAQARPREHGPLLETPFEFDNLPAPGRNRSDQGLTATEMKRCCWVKPTMVCQVKFTEWTRDDRLRQPVFLGLREDKSAIEVVREQFSAATS